MDQGSILSKKRQGRRMGWKRIALRQIAEMLTYLEREDAQVSSYSILVRSMAVALADRFSNQED